MFKTSTVSLAFGTAALGLLALSGSPAANAGTVVAAVGVTSPEGDFGFPYNLSNAITASSGLSQSYVDGVTDFDTLVSTATYNGFGGATFTFTGYPQYYLFDLGTTRRIDALGLWAEKNPGDGSPTSFSLYAGTTTGDPLLGTFNSTGGQPNAPGQEFDFAATNTQFVLFEVLTIDATPDFSPSIGQVVFDNAPEPATLAIFGLGIAALGLTRRKRAA